MWIIYGIHNCDTVKKARSWLNDRQIKHRFHDFRADGLDPELLQGFIDILGMDVVLNRRSTSWRQLSIEQQQASDHRILIQLMQNTPTLIKRPILDTGKNLIAGFSPDDYQKML
ncbi:MAG: ArsC family reductase [Methylomonas sp.]|jgi:Spx/MgsR family transcriptional regulator